MRNRLTVSIIAIVAALGTFFIAQLVDAEPKVMIGMDGDPEAMSWYHVLIFTVVLSVVAWLLAWFLQRFETGRIIFTVIGVIVFMGAFIPFGQLGLEGADLVWQTVIHVVVAAVILIGYWATWPTAATARDG